ncbi:unnamed protein product [Heterobilharzia americana]|nr:unnamed protein product [Heterobilharzia americana]
MDVNQSLLAIYYEYIPKCKTLYFSYSSIIQGIEKDLRPIVWKYLLGYYQWTYTTEENERLRVEKSREYHMLKAFLEANVS